MIQNGSFLGGFILAVESIGQIGFLVLIGYVLVREKWIGPSTLSDMTGLLINLIIPASFILSMARSFTPELLKHGLVLMIMSTSWILGSWALTAGWFRVFPGKSGSGDRSVTAMVMISNSIYLPLPVILAVTPKALHDQATVYISIGALPSIAIMWTVGVILLCGATRPCRKDRLKLAVNPPIISLFIGILLTFIPGIRDAAVGEPGAWIPLKMVFSVMGYLSQTLSPLAMLVLGGFIASSTKTQPYSSRYVIPLIGIRLLLVPGLVYAVLRSGILQIPPLAATVLLLVAAAPSATNASLIARKYEGEWELVSSLQLVVHAVALLTLPLWLSLGLEF